MEKFLLIGLSIFSWLTLWWEGLFGELGHGLIDLCRWRINPSVLGGASNWIGTYKKGYKNLCDVRPWRKITGIVPDDPAPFSTLKLEPRAGNALFRHSSIRTMKVLGVYVVNSWCAHLYMARLVFKNGHQKTCDDEIEQWMMCSKYKHHFRSDSEHKWESLWDRLKEQDNLHFGPFKRLHLYFSSEASIESAWMSQFPIWSSSQEGIL